MRAPAPPGPSAAPPTAPRCGSSTRRAPRTPRRPSPRRTPPSTTAPGATPRPASAATSSSRSPTCSSATSADVARAESLDTGKRLVEAEYDVADVASVFRYYGRVAAEDAGRIVDTGNADVVSRVVHEPVGVCGLIAPWNYPLLQASWKVAPCLAAGNTFVLKPSELTPSTSIHLMRILEEAGLPKGVGNLVLGAGPEAGAPLATRPARRPGLLHRRPADRPRDHGRGRADGEEDRPRARRQEPQHRLRGRRPRRRPRLRTHRGLPALRPGLLRRRPPGRRGVDPRLVRRRAGRAGAADPARRAVRREGRDRCPHQRRAPRQGGGVRRRRPGRGRRAAVRWPGARRPGVRRRLLLPAHGPGRLPQRHDGHPGGVLRPGADGRDVLRRGRGGPDRQRQPVRPGRRGLDPGRRQGPARRGPAADGHGLDQRLPPVRPAGRVGRLQAVRASAASSASTAWRSTARPSTSGTTSGRRCRRGSTGATRDGQVRRGDRRRRVRRLRAGQPALRRSRHQRPRPGGRPVRLAPRPVHPHAGGAADPDRQPVLRLEVRDRPRARHERPPRRRTPAARSSAGPPASTG